MLDNLTVCQIYRFAKFFHPGNRSFSTSRIFLKKQEEKPLLKYIGKHHTRAKRIYVWGNTRTGALGVPTFLYPKDGKRQLLAQFKPYNLHWPIRAGFDVTHIAAGCGFTILAGSMKDKSLALYGFGLNTDSQLGFHSSNGKVLDYLLSQEAIELPDDLVQSPVEFVSIGCGRAHTVVATKKAIFTFGNNALGQCGRDIVEGEVYKGSRIVHKIDMTDVVKVVCGYDHTLILTSDGKVWSCGLGTDGQTGLGHYKTSGKITRVEGEIVDVHIKDIACRCDTVLAVSAEGDVFGWGNSEYGQLDMITNDPQVNSPRHLPISSACGKVKVVAASGTSCALLNEKGEVYVWGYGILGMGPKVQESTEPQLLPMPLFGLTAFSKDIQVTGIYSGISCLAALTNTKSLYTWGHNPHGCLGLGHKQDQFFPFLVSTGSEVNDVACGADHMVANCRAFI
ncbi:RCC1-like G exchanging factor-like protein [Watersipora subatra]|uniref:RCC1-like G exchanging factor-like protein n=1 Tax=Watersipora subatra TaxID=2589382 RepID=UPI00355BBD43